MQVRYPRCVGFVEWEGNPWRLFYSERCKLVDLGAWVDEEYKIPRESSSEGDQKQADAVQSGNEDN
ncbi:MAG: DNA gyrase inhibitor YacG [Thermodesulfobacteriota bacterium]